LRSGDGVDDLLHGREAKRTFARDDHAVHGHLEDPGSSANELGLDAQLLP
jgi:hypothetical protein